MREADCTTRRSPGGRSRGLIVLLLLAVFTVPQLNGCGGGESGGDAGGRRQGNPRAQDPAGERPSEPPIPVAVEKAELGPIARYYTATATLAPEKETELLARVSGVILELSCEEGDVVEEGDPLLRIEDAEYRLRFDQAEAAGADLEARHQRASEMLDQGLVSPEEFEAVERDLKSARAEEELARLNLSYTTVTAPFAGKIVERLVDVGRNVSPATPLLVLSDFTPLLARVHVPAREFRDIQPDQPVDLVLDSNQARLRGRIKLVSPVIDPASGTIKVTIEIPEYPPGTRPGDFAEVRIVTEHRAASVLVPKAAVVTDRGEQVVYVAGDSTAERRVVEVGFENDVHVEVLHGLDDAEYVVVKGQRSLKHGAFIKVLEEDGEEVRETAEGEA